MHSISEVIGVLVIITVYADYCVAHPELYFKIKFNFNNNFIEIVQVFNRLNAKKPTPSV